MSKSDPLDHLRDTWQQVDTPPVTRRLEDEDEATRKVVNWMEEAWRQVEIPAADLPPQQPLLQLRKWTLPSTAALAAALLISAIMLWDPRPEILSESESSQLAVDRPSETKEQRADGPLRKASQLTTSTLIANAPEKMEILTGRVRLTMLRGQYASTEPNSKNY